MIMKRSISIWILISNIVCIYSNNNHNNHHSRHNNHVHNVNSMISEYLDMPSWIVHFPETFLSNRTHKPGNLLDISHIPAEIERQKEFSDHNLAPIDDYTDGEIIDALEHFFWGKKAGLSLELGALDGSPSTRSNTHALQYSLDWDRMLIDANPTYRNDMMKHSPNALSINAAICNTPGKVHFAHSEYIGGIIEFMSQGFLSQYHNPIYKAGIPPGNISSIDWTTISNVREIECIPLAKIFHYFRINHINFFVLDVEGGEFEILKSIDWNMITFDVLCIETEPSNRPPGYDIQVTQYLEEKGYKNYTGQIGRNIWYIHQTFIPSKRPGLASDCFNGWKKSDHALRRYLNKRTPSFERCHMDDY